MTENPERLWVTCASDGVAIETRGYDNKRDADAYRDGLHSHRNAHAFTPVAEYVRADIAAAREAALAAERDALRAKVKEQEDVARIFREMADEQVDRAVAERDALRAECDRLARLGWAAITTIRAMSEIGSASFFGRAAEDTALDGDLSEGRQFNATRMTHLNEADRLDDIVKAVLADDEAAALSGKGVG